MAEQNHREEEREQLAEKLDKDIDDFISSLEKKPYTDGFTEANWEKEMEEHPAFMTKLPEDGELPPLIQAFQSLKYGTEENSPEELAVNYKEDGNYNFKLKQYRLAVKSYSEGIKQIPNNSELNAQLYTNRAAAHYHLNNFRSALSDCQQARTYKSDHIKAIVRGIQCFISLNKLDDALNWCSEGLNFAPQEKMFQDFQRQAEQQKKIDERNKRKAATEKRKYLAVFNAIKERNIRITKLENGDDCDEDLLESYHAADIDSRISLNDNGHLVWPVTFMYPEYFQTDFIQAFDEHDRFKDHLIEMFGPNVEPPCWDEDKKYIFDSLQIYFEDKVNNKIIVVKTNSKLQEPLMDKRYIVVAGIPSFIILVKGSKFEKEFLSKYTR